MFDFNANLSQLSPEQRTRLAEVLKLRAEYMDVAADFNRRKAALLDNPTDTAELALSEFSAVVVGPLRRRLTEQTLPLLTEAVDLDTFKGMLPMVMMGLLSAIDVPMLLNLLGLDADEIAMIIVKGKEFLQGDND